MARENTKFEEGNFTSDGTYYYSMLSTSQSLLQKVDDGTVAFSFPLDVSVEGPITEIHWDGVYFWSLENNAAGDGVIVRKWAIEAFICKQKAKFEYTDGATHTYDCAALCIESYKLSVGINSNGSDYTLGLTDIVISDTSMLSPGDVLTFVRKDTPTSSRQGTTFVEQVTVNTIISSTIVQLTAPMTGTPHGNTPGSNAGFRGPDVNVGVTLPATPDEVYVTKHIWMANENSPNNPGVPSLYKIRSSNGSNIIQYSGTQYSYVTAMVHYAQYNQASNPLSNSNIYNVSVTVDPNLGGTQSHILLSRKSTLLFFNAATAIIDRSMVMNNIKEDTVGIWDVYDMVVTGVQPNIVLYRLQLGTTYLTPALVVTNTTWSKYSYEKQLLRRVVNSIAITADPSIIPADGVTPSNITAVVRDQYNDIVSSKTVNWTEDGSGSLTSVTSASNSEGKAVNQYLPSTTEEDVKIVASITNGLV